MSVLGENYDPGFNPEQLKNIFAQARLAADASKTYQAAMMQRVDREDGGGADDMFWDMPEHLERRQAEQRRAEKERQ